MKNYYLINHTGEVNSISKETAFRLCIDYTNDYITCYDDGDNIFIADCSSDPCEIIEAIIATTGYFKANYKVAYC